MSIDLDDPYWKDLADYLRMLNVEFYGKTRFMIPENPGYRSKPSPKLSEGEGIYMAKKQEDEQFLVMDDQAHDSKMLHEPDYSYERCLK